MLFRSSHLGNSHVTLAVMRRRVLGLYHNQGYGRRPRGRRGECDGPGGGPPGQRADIPAGVPIAAGARVAADYSETAVERGMAVL